MPATLSGLVDQRSHSLIRRARPQGGFDLGCVDKIREPVRAQQDLIARAQSHPLVSQRGKILVVGGETQAQIRFGQGAASEVPEKDMGMRVVGDLLRRDHGCVQRFLNPGVIGGDLVQAVLAQQVCATVPNPGSIQAVTEDPG